MAPARRSLVGGRDQREADLRAASNSSPGVQVGILAELAMRSPTVSCNCASWTAPERSQSPWYSSEG